MRTLKRKDSTNEAPVWGNYFSYGRIEECPYPTEACKFSEREFRLTPDAYLWEVVEVEFKILPSL